MVQNLAEIQHQQNMKRDKYNFIFLFFVYEKTKNLFHTKFTKKITFGNNIKLKYPYNIYEKYGEIKLKIK